MKTSIKLILTVLTFVCLLLLLNKKAESRRTQLQNAHYDNEYFAQKKKPKKPVVTVKDADADGLPDDEDMCPDIYGSLQAKGCPDTDSDGIADFEDDCPNAPGLAQYNGCPDTDGDGVPDNIDVCPQEKGPTSNNGCPVAKTIDPEDINNPDEQEKQKAQALEEAIQEYERFLYERSLAIPVKYEGERYVPVKIDMIGGGEGAKPIEAETKTTPENNEPITVQEESTKVVHKVYATGLSVNLSQHNIARLEKILSNITFETGRMLLTSTSFAYLDELATVMYEYPEWKIILHCYANETSNDFRDLKLSTNRGQAIKSYLVNKKRIHPSRIDYKGYGSYTDGKTPPVSKTDIEISLLK